MANWKRITLHLQQYWIREVLGKFPVMQHLRFGTIFPLSWEPSREENRRQLEYVKPPEVDSHNQSQATSQNKTDRNKSHMSQGNLDEFTVIKTRPNE